jgi:prepilin-type N-terminal cleavage/methylation domain-containing protein
MRERRGITLVELIVVIVVLAIVAALTLTGLLASRRASNERHAAAVLKTLASGEADFRGNDRDGNKIQDFWTRDVAGLYGVVPVGSQEMIKLIELTIAGADFAAAGVSRLGVTGLEEVDRDRYTPPAPTQGYWLQRMLADETNTSYQTCTSGIIRADETVSLREWWNHAKFGFYAFPDTYAKGRNVFFINEGNTIFKRAMNGPVKPASAVPNATGILLPIGTEGLVGSQPAETWPTDDPAPTNGFHGPD